MDGELALLNHDFGRMSTYRTHRASIFSLRATVHFAHFYLPGGVAATTGGGEGARFAHFLHPCQDSSVKEALQPERGFSPRHLLLAL